MSDLGPAGDPGFLQCLIDAVADPVFVKDRQHRWVVFNQAFATLLGRSPAELTGKSDYDYFPKAQADVFWRQDELVFETGRENMNEETLTDAAGRTHVLVTLKRLWTGPDGEKYLQSSIRDITDELAAADSAKLSEERLSRARRLEAIGHLAGGVAHDFNNLLTAIRGCAALLLENLPPGDPSRIEAEDIRSAGERAATLTGRLLSFSRRPGGLARPTDMREIVAGMRDMLRRLLPPDIELDVILPKELGLVLVDPGAVEQVLLNLVVNAGEAMLQGGAASIELSEALSGGGGVRGRCVRLTVRDSGPGLNESTRARIFEPFFTTKEHGSGLGLSTVAETVRASAGGVEVESEPGCGAVFHVYWPVTAAGAMNAAVSTPAGEAPGRKRGRALVVDDDEAVRRFAVRCLEHDGYEVLSASEPAEALRIAEANAGLFELLLVDVVMPRMRGPELAARLSAGQPGAKVLFTSGRRREDCGLPAGEHAFLAKPFTKTDLLASVSAARRGAGGPSRRARRPGRAPSRRKAS